MFLETRGAGVRDLNHFTLVNISVFFLCHRNFQPDKPLDVDKRLKIMKDITITSRQPVTTVIERKKERKKGRKKEREKEEKTGRYVTRSHEIFQRSIGGRLRGEKSRNARLYHDAVRYENYMIRVLVGQVSAYTCPG